MKTQLALISGMLFAFGCSQSLDFDREYPQASADSAMPDAAVQPTCSDFADKIIECMPSFCENKSYTSDILNHLENYLTRLCSDYYTGSDDLLREDYYPSNIECESSEDLVMNIVRGDILGASNLNSIENICNNSELVGINEEDCEETCLELSRCFPEPPDENSLIKDQDQCVESCLIHDFPGREFFYCSKENLECDDESGDPNRLRGDRREINICLSLIDYPGCSQASEEIANCMSTTCTQSNESVCEFTCSQYCIFSCMSSNNCIIEHNEGFSCSMDCFTNPERIQEYNGDYERCLNDRCSRVQVGLLFLCANDGLDLDVNNSGCVDRCEDHDECMNYCRGNRAESVSFNEHKETMEFMSNIECKRMSIFGDYTYENFDCDPRNSDVQELFRNIAYYHEMSDPLFQTDLMTQGCLGGSEVDQICLDACTKSLECDIDRYGVDTNDHIAYFYEECSVRCMYQYIEDFDAFNCFSIRDGDECSCASILEIAGQDLPPPPPPDPPLVP